MDWSLLVSVNVCLWFHFVGVCFVRVVGSIGNSNIAVNLSGLHLYDMMKD